MFPVEQDVADLFNRITFIAHFLNLFAGPVFRRVRHGVAAITVSLDLEDIRTIPRPTMFDRAFTCIFDCQHIHAVDRFAGDSERFAALPDFGARGRALLRCAHCILVVLDDENHRQFPQGGHVESLVNLTLIGRTVAKIGKGDVVVPLVFVGKGDARPKRHVGTNDTMAAVKLFLFREHVHGTALAAGIAAFAACQFCHDAIRVHPACQHMPVIAVGGDAAVAFLGRRLEPDDNSFLSDVEMAETADQSHAIKLARFFLEPPDQQHIPVIGL